tara:strand:- start:209 stop:607 length:399 start_codon:yes stop_codon:yes gene_type:complete
VARRLLIFSVGFFMGCVLVYTTMFKGTDREFYGSWLPEGRVIKKLNSSLNRDHSSYQCILDKSGVFESEVDEMFVSGDIDFEKSNTESSIRKYFVNVEINENRNVVAEISLARDSAWISQIGVSNLSFKACD